MFFGFIYYLFFCFGVGWVGLEYIVCYVILSILLYYLLCYWEIFRKYVKVCVLFILLNECEKVYVGDCIILL